MEVASHRACAGCRSLKTKCLLDEKNPGICLRCARFGRQCVFTPIQKRKPRKRTDARVTELEKEMTAMRELLKRKESDPGSSMSATPDMEAIEPMEVSHLQSAANNVLSRQAPSDIYKSACRKDVVDEGLLSMDTARQLLEQYKVEIYPHFPGVFVAPSTTADELRRTKPSLFLAIIAAAAGIESPKLAARLDEVLLEEYANRTVVKSEKSLELVQSLLISALWYQPPTRLGKIKQFEYIHMASMMATDIGIVSRPANDRRRRRGPNTNRDDAMQSDLDFQMQYLGMDEGTGSIEARRTLLAAYATTAGVAMSLRRTAMMRITSHLQESLDLIERSPQAALCDGLLTAWNRLLIIVDGMSNAFSYDDLGAIASVYDAKTPMLLSAYEKQLSEWNLSVDEMSYSPMLRMTFYAVRLHLFELYLHVDHSPEDFKTPFHMGPVQPCSDEQLPISSGVAGIVDLVESSHALLDVFLHIDAVSARGIPVFGLHRVSYAGFVLAKLCASASSPSSKLAHIINWESLRAVEYLDKTIHHLRCIIGPNGCRVPAIFLTLLSQMRQWCTHPELVGEPPVDKAMSVPELTLEEASSGDTSPETVGGTPGMTPAVVNGDSETAYESYAGDHVVKQAIAHGLTYPSPINDGSSMAFDSLPQVQHPEDSVQPLDSQSDFTAASASTDLDSWPTDMNNLDGNDNFFSYSEDINAFLLDMDMLPGDTAASAFDILTGQEQQG